MFQVINVFIKEWFHDIYKQYKSSNLVPMITIHFLYLLEINTTDIKVTSASLVFLAGVRLELTFGFEHI